MDLGGSWTLRQIGTLPEGSPPEPIECIAKVPGEVHVHLGQERLIADPHVGYREVRLFSIYISSAIYNYKLMQ